MEVAPGELFDRLSIIQLKSERLDNPNVVNNELTELQQAYEEIESEHQTLTVNCKDMVSLLKIINGYIWDLESDIRRGKEKQLGLEEVGRRALMIRDLNSVRVWTKNLVTKATGKGPIEYKKDHASEIAKHADSIVEQMAFVK
ncbi:MAG: hypothetical protein JEZ07_07810 [Phycisphaerae bacterium]|nr:hypothetical protein [Phycisphaerae bacterium]